LLLLLLLLLLFCFDGDVVDAVSIMSYVFLPMTQQPPEGQGLPIIKGSQSHSDTIHSVGLPWTSDQPDEETSTWQHTTLTRDMFREAYRSSSGALTVFAASGLHTHVVTETCWAFNEWWNNNFYYKVVSCWLFLLSHTTMHGSMNIRHSFSAGIRTHNPSKRETANLRLRPRGHCCRPCHTVLFNSQISFSDWKYG